MRDGLAIAPGRQGTASVSEIRRVIIRLSPGFDDQAGDPQEEQQTDVDHHASGPAEKVCDRFLCLQIRLVNFHFSLRLVATFV